MQQAQTPASSSQARDRSGVQVALKRRSAERFIRARKADLDYSRKLRGVARQVGSIVRAYAPDGVVTNPADLTQMLERYAELLRPWARTVALGMLTDVGRRNENAWAEHGREMARALRTEIETAPTGDLLRRLLDEQVTLITSLPLDAAQRVHKLTTESLIDSSRASTIAKEILRSEEVTASRATLIARTETARTAASLTQARAQYVGSTHYIWHSQTDSDTRPSHRAMNGKIFRWDDPPEVDENGRYMRHGPGEIWNCRCWAEPIIPDVL